MEEFIDDIVDSDGTSKNETEMAAEIQETKAVETDKSSAEASTRAPAINHYFALGPAASARGAESPQQYDRSLLRQKYNHFYAIEFQKVRFEFGLIFHLIVPSTTLPVSPATQPGMAAGSSSVTVAN